MGREINLLSRLPQVKRNVADRRADRDAEVVRVSRQFGQEYFDGDRKYGYGGYRYDGRWPPIARDMVEHYGLCFSSDRVLDVGCAKGFLVADLAPLVDAYGIDISRYAVVENPHPDVVGRLHLGSAIALPFPDKSFDLVVSINTLHNLERPDLIKALREITRVSRGPAYVVVDSYRTPEERALFMDWVLTARYHGYPDDWLELFAEAGYEGDYSWTII